MTINLTYFIKGREPLKNNTHTRAFTTWALRAFRIRRKGENKANCAYLKYS